MTTPPLDPNSWYTLSTANDPTTLLMSTALFSRSNTAGAVFFTSAAPNNATQRWQLWPVNPERTEFVLRTQEGGANAFMGTQPADGNGVISPLMLRGDVADASVVWTMGPWGDGTWWMANGGNGSAYHLARNRTGVFMDANVTAPQNAQRWGFGKGQEINDGAYSSVNLLGVASTATMSSETSSSTSKSAGTTGTEPSTGLSTPAKAGLGAALGIAALIALIVLGLFFRRRRAQKRVETAKDAVFEPYQVAPTLPERRSEFVKHELDQGNESAKYEMPQQAMVEVDAIAQERPAELEGDVERRRG